MRKKQIYNNKSLCFSSLFSFSLLHSFNSEDDTSRRPCLAPPSALSSIPSSLSRSLPHLFLHFSHLDSILGCLFTASVFQSPILPLFLYFPSPAAPSITHSLLLTSPSPCYLLSVCPCSVSPLAHLSLSPCAYCHHAQCPPTRLTPLFLALCLLSLSFFLFPYFHYALMHTLPHTHAWSPSIMWLLYTLKWYLISQVIKLDNT